MLSYATVFFAVASLASAAPMYLNPATRQSCDIAACGVALAPTGVGCVSAAVKLGADPFADAGCVAGVTNLGVNTPAACEPCFSAIGDLIPEPIKDAAEDAGDAIGDVFSDVKDGITGLFSRQEGCDIAACGVALAPTGVGCVSAAVKLGADPFADAGCVAGVTNLGVNTPAACAPCFSAVGDLIPEPIKDVAEDVGDAIGDAFSDVKDGISGLFGRQESCDFARCGVALAPTGVSCVTAAVQAGANVISDVACAVSVLNLGLNTPDACRPCLDQLKALVPEPLQPVVEAASDVKETINEGIDTVVDEATDFFGGLFDRQESCDIDACGVALAPTGVSCVAAAVELGANPFADAGCVAGVVNLGVNTPDVCKPCFSSLGDAISEVIPDEVEDAVSDAGDAVSGAFDDVKDGISGLFN